MSRRKLRLGLRNFYCYYNIKEIVWSGWRDFKYQPKFEIKQFCKTWIKKRFSFLTNKTKQRFIFRFLVHMMTAEQKKLLSLVLFSWLYHSWFLKVICPCQCQLYPSIHRLFVIFHCCCFRVRPVTMDLKDDRDPQDLLYVTFF